jgi:hypothetical protein
MLRFCFIAVTLFSSALLASCAVAPGMPPDFMLPVQQLIVHAVCELHFALEDINRTHPSFLKNAWAISITLTPKVDTEGALRAGLTGKSSSLSGPKFFDSWTVGNAPGAEYDIKGHTDGTAVYLTKSTALLNKKYQSDNCDTSSVAYNSLTRYLGVRDWVERIAAAADASPGGLTQLDKPTYNSEITIQIDGSGTFTYNQPFGTDFLNGYGSYKLDEAVAIAFVAEPAKKTVTVRTLPSGAEYSSVSAAPTTISSAAKSELSTLGLQQQIINLQTSVERRR